jgi:hypothetical protein
MPPARPSTARRDQKPRAVRQRRAALFGQSLMHAHLHVQIVLFDFVLFPMLHEARNEPRVGLSFPLPYYAHELRCVRCVKLSQNVVDISSPAPREQGSHAICVCDSGRVLIIVSMNVRPARLVLSDSTLTKGIELSSTGRNVCRYLYPDF